MKNNIDLPDGYDYEGPFIKQTKHSDFKYTIDYKARQSTNVQMSFLRMGWLSAHIPYEEMSQMNVVDIGSGNGAFIKNARSVFKRVRGYDLAGNSITKEELYETTWDLIVMSDVLEHFHDISDLFEMKWKYAMITFPETPEVDSFEDLMKWRHFKPNEHIYHLDLKGMEEWLANIDSSVEVVGSGHFEDHIRKRWDDRVPNITTMLVKRTI